MQYRSVIYYRNTLSPTARRAYDAMVRGWMAFDEFISLPPRDYDVKEAVKAVSLDYPLLFHVNYYRIAYTRSPLKIRLRGDYFYSRQEARRLLDLCENWGRAVTGSMPRGLTDRQKAGYLQRCLVSHTRYAQTGREAHNVIGPIRNGEAVCEGIAKAFKYLCDLVEIPCILVAGTMEREPHAWTKLWLNGRAGFMDVTNALHDPGLLRDVLVSQSFRWAHQYAWDTEKVPDAPDYF